MITLFTILIWLGSGSNIYKTAQGNVTFVDSDFQYSVPGYPGPGFTARSTAGYVEIICNEQNISVKVGGNWSGHTTQSDCEILVDGVYYTSVRLTHDSVIEVHPITLPKGSHLITLVNGYTANAVSTTNVVIPKNGVYIQGVVTDSVFQIVSRPTPRPKWLFIGNSITTGASADHPAVTDFLGMFRSEGRRIQSDSWGARRLLTYIPVNAHSMASFVSAEMNSTISNELFMFLGTNNFTVGGGQTKALFKTEVQLFLDSVHVQRPDIKIYVISPMNRNNYSVPNAMGATCEDYADAERELLTTRTWAKFIYGKPLLTLANTIDGVHPKQIGHKEVHDKLLIQYNLLQQ